MRGLLFTLVSARRFFPEILPLLEPSAAGHGLRGPLIGHAVSVAGFNVLQAGNPRLPWPSLQPPNPTLTLTPNPHVLQLYWLYLTLAYTLKNGLGGERPS